MSPTPSLVGADGAAMGHDEPPYEDGEICPFASGPLAMPRIGRGADGNPIPMPPAPTFAPAPCMAAKCMFWHAPTPAEDAEEGDAPADGGCIIKTSLMFMAGQAEQQTMLLDDVVTAMEHEGILGPVDADTGERGPSKKQQRAAEKETKPRPAPQATDPVASPGDAERAAELAEEKKKQDAASAAAPSS